MFATSHLCLPWWIHCPLACSVAKESQRSFHLCGERFSFVEDNEKVRLSEGRPSGNVSPFSSSSRGIKHIFRAYPSTLKIAEPCFETTAAHSTIIWSARLGFLPPREAGTGFVGVLPLPSTHAWSSRKHRSLYAETTHKTAFAIPSRNQAPDVSNYKEDGVVNRFLTARRHFWTPWSERTHYMENGQSVFFISPHLPYVFGHVSPGGVLPYKSLMGTCGHPGYVFRDFCLKQGIEFIIFCLNQGIDLSTFVLNRISVLNRVSNIGILS